MSSRVTIIVTNMTICARRSVKMHIYFAILTSHNKELNKMLIRMKVQTVINVYFML